MTPARKSTAHGVSSLKTVSVPAALLLLSLALPRVGVAQVGSLYVVAKGGRWVERYEGRLTVLDILSGVAPSATLELEDGEGAATDTTNFIVLRNPRTLGKATIICSPASPCRGPLDVSRLRFPRSGPEASRQVEAMYTDLGANQLLRSRIRLVGARGYERELGVLVLGRQATGIDLTDLLSRFREPASGLVARFCSLTHGNDADDCIDSRMMRVGDCALTDAVCAGALSEGVYRVDVYVRERRMLGSVATSAGFAAVVPASRVPVATAKRDSLMHALSSIRKELTAEEARGLAAAAARSVGAVER